MSTRGFHKPFLLRNQLWVKLLNKYPPLTGILFSPSSFQGLGFTLVNFPLQASLDRNCHHKIRHFKRRSWVEGLGRAITPASTSDSITDFTRNLLITSYATLKSIES